MFQFLFASVLALPQDEHGSSENKESGDASGKYPLTTNQILFLAYQQ